MSSKAHRAALILKNEGPITFIERVTEYFRHIWDEYGIPPTERHIQHLQEKEDLVIAEIGVWRGGNAKRLLSDLDVDEMYLIDPYDAYEDYEESKAKSEKLKLAKEEAHNKLEEFQNIHWIEQYSDEALSEIDKPLDYIYIDGNHSYGYVKKDMENYHPLLKDGGILAGDDIDWDGVAQAFVEFSVENNIQPHLEPHHPDWYFIKQQEIQS